MSTYLGYFILLLYILLLSAIFCFIKKRYKGYHQTMTQYIFAGKNIPTFLLTTSVFTSWLWVTTMIGSAEACVLYGISGAMGYGLGATISFLLLVPLILLIQKQLPKSVTFLEFTQNRYSLHVKNTYYIFALLVACYVTIEQAAGLGFVFAGIFGTSYKYIAFCCVMIGVIFLIFTGMRGALFNDFVNFFIIILGFFFFLFLLYTKLDAPSLLAGLSQVQTNPDNVNYNPDVLTIAYGASIRYFLLSIVIAFGQLFFDPSYYVKAHIAKNKKSMMQAFLVAGLFLWLPICLISALSFGLVSISMNIDFSNSLNISVDIATKLLMGLSSQPLMLLFSVLILCISMTTITHYLIGIQSIFTLDFYTSSIKANATEKERLLFGKVIVILVGSVCALIAISLENISLLTIDMFSGVFFAAPCGALIFGIFSKKAFKNLPIASIILGLVCGFTLIFITRNTVSYSFGWFVGTMGSFLFPFVFMGLCGLFLKKPQKPPFT